MRWFWAPRESRAAIWKRGESVAARAMRGRGCRVVARNLVVGPGEIDLLCRERRTGQYVIVEVKARLIRGDRSAYRPEDAVTADKRRKLLTLARTLLREERVRRSGVRIDVVAVEFRPGRRRAWAVRHYERAVSAD